MGKLSQVKAFRSIRYKILVFSILVTLLPSLGIGWFWFDQTRRATSEKVEQRLLDSAGFAEKEINLWLEERGYELRVFANSPLVQETILFKSIEGTKEAGSIDEKFALQTRKVNNYLSLVQERYSDYRRLMILDSTGKIIAASDNSAVDRQVILPGDWEEQVSKLRLFYGDIFSVKGEDAPLLLVGIPLFVEKAFPNRAFFVMEVRLHGIARLLRNSLPLSGSGRDPYEISLFRMNGELIVSTLLPASESTTLVSPQEVVGLFATPGQVKEFVNDQQERFVSLLIPFSHPPWQILVTEKYDTIFAGLIRSRDRVILIVALLTLAIGGVATIIASQILTPLKDLTKAVLQVVDGELDVEVAVRRQDELGLVTQMFNTMTTNLKEDQQKLELLATTDSLTGLANRKQVISELSKQIDQYRRHGRTFCVLMLDIDHFKMVNDMHGHLVGDAVLVQLARIFNETLRTLDCAGRFGGEEFLIILAQTAMYQAMHIAERIRQAVEQSVFTYEDVGVAVTISIGVAEMSPESLTINDVINKADLALYEAKKTGRNRIVSGLRPLSHSYSPSASPTILLSNR
jgi:diguanylate cyclase (GGDEF)-like protein